MAKSPQKQPEPENPTPAAPADGDGGAVALEKDAGKGTQADAQGETVAEKQAAAPSPLAPLGSMEIDATARAALVGTIGSWSASGVAEIDRVHDLFGEHGDWTAEEMAEFRAAFTRLAEAACRAARAAATETGLFSTLAALEKKLTEEGYSSADVLSVSEDGRIAVTRDGQKVQVP